MQWARVPSASLEDLARHRVFAPDSDVDADDRPEVAEAARAVWQRDHLDPLDVEAEIRAAADARREADARLDVRWLGLAVWAGHGLTSGQRPG